MPGATEDNVRPDEVSIHINDELVEGPEVDEGTYENLPSIPKRPKKSADIADWVDYCADALGADRAFLEGDTTHGKHIIMHDPDSGEEVQVPMLDKHQNIVTETIPALTKKELIALADRLGG